MPPVSHDRLSRAFVTTLGVVVVLLLSSFVGALSTPVARATGDPSSVDVSATFSVTFIAKGLPSGTPWQATLGQYWVNSNNSIITISNVTDGTYWYTVQALNYATINSTASVTVNGANQTVPLQFSLAPYSVTFVESGLPTGYLLNVTFGGFFESGYPSDSFHETTAWYSFSVQSYGSNYTADPSVGGVSVGDANVTVGIAFESQNLTPHYAITFSEMGLAPGTPWTVGLVGYPTSWAPDPPNGTITTTGSQANFSLPNGEYNYTVSEVPGYWTDPYGSFEVYGAASGIEVEYGTGPYPYGNASLTFHETGLPGGTSWSVVIGKLVETSLTANVTWIVANGTYDYSVRAVPGYEATYAGSVVVDGSVVVPITFQLAFPVVFAEQGLPEGDGWGVTATNAANGFHETQSSVTSSITLSLSDGTYQIGITLPSGWTGSFNETEITVDGQAATGPTVTATNSAPASSGVPFEDLILVTIGALVIVAGVVIAIRRRRKPPAFLVPEPGQA